MTSVLLKLPQKCKLQTYQSMILYKSQHVLLCVPSPWVNIQAISIFLEYPGL